MNELIIPLACKLAYGGPLKALPVYPENFVTDRTKLHLLYIELCLKLHMYIYIPYMMLKPGNGPCRNPKSCNLL